MNPEQTSTASPIRYPGFVVSAIAVANLALIALSFTPWFGGTAKAEGLADRLFGSMRLGGYRADFAWLFFSTVVLFFAGIVAALSASGNRLARRVAILCGVEVISYVFYMFYSIRSGQLYFG